MPIRSPLLGKHCDAVIPLEMLLFALILSVGACHDLGREKLSPPMQFVSACTYVKLNRMNGHGSINLTSFSDAQVKTLRKYSVELTGTYTFRTLSNTIQQRGVYTRVGNLFCCSYGDDFDLNSLFVIDLTGEYTRSPDAQLIKFDKKALHLIEYGA